MKSKTNIQKENEKPITILNRKASRFSYEDIRFF